MAVRIQQLHFSYHHEGLCVYLRKEKGFVLHLSAPFKPSSVTINYPSDAAVVLTRQSLSLIYCSCDGVGRGVCVPAISVA